ncbi:MAG: VWA domain-containing protein [Myxococcota bacterium]
MKLEALTGWDAASSVGTSNRTKVQIGSRLASSEKLRKLAQEAGRFRRMALEKRAARVEHGVDELHDVGLGREVSRLLPVELANLADSELEAWFDLGWSEGRLVQYELEGNETRGEGPIVVLLDRSSSMEGAAEVWSKALTLGLLQVALLQQRWCRVVSFNSHVVRQDDFRHGTFDLQQLVASLEDFGGGGTAFKPLRSALKAIEEDAGLKQADIVLVTDGQAEVSEGMAARWEEARRRNEFTAFGVFIGQGEPPVSLARITDKQYTMTELADDHHVVDALLGI